MTTKLENELYCLSRAFSDLGLSDTPESNVLRHLLMNSNPIDAESKQRFIMGSVVQMGTFSETNPSTIFEGSLDEYYIVIRERWLDIAKRLHGVKE